MPRTKADFLLIIVIAYMLSNFITARRLSGSSHPLGRYYKVDINWGKLDRTSESGFAN